MKETNRIYSASVKEASKELTAKEKIMLKDLSNAESLDLATTEAEFNNTKTTINVDFYAKIAVHNEKAEDKDYETLVVVDKNGTKYYTGSQSFATAFMDIYDEMTEAGETEIVIEVYRKESKTYKGKQFITCSII